MDFDEVSDSINVNFTSLLSSNLVRVPTISSSCSSAPQVENQTSIMCKKTKVTKRNRRKKLSPEKIESLKQVEDLWHRKMGHISAPYINELMHVALGVEELLCAMSINNCKICAKAKLTRKTFNKDRERATRVGEIMHADLIGPVTPITKYTKQVHNVPSR